MLQHPFTYAQCPTSGFSADASVCINESLTLTNTSSNAVNYEWEFCSGDLATTPTASLSLTSTDLRTQSLKIVEDGGSFYGFTVKTSGNTLVRLDFGTDLANTPTVTDLGNIGGLLSAPEELDLIKEGGVWYGLLTNITSDDLLRLTFGAGLGAAPTLVESLGNLGTLDQMINVQIEKNSDELVAFVAALNGTLYRIDFSGSILNTPTNSDVDKLSIEGGLFGLSFI